ncbi:10 TM acyl transferase domain found in Cas1p-domain-containing protein, partial [Truncatella angustata]
IAQNDPYHCRSLLSHGNWPARTSNWDPERAFEKWEPASCRMVEYSRDAFHDCLGGRRVVFAGDSTVRQIYWAAATRLDHMKAHVALLDVFVDDTKHDNLQFEAEGVKLEFIWDPWLNSSALHSELTKFRVQETFADIGTIKSKDEESAALIVIGAPGLWAARHGGDEYFEIFKHGVESIKIHLGSNLDGTLSSPSNDLRRNYDEAPNQILLAPVLVPWYDELSANRATTITPERIDKMNQYLRGLPRDAQSHVLWTYNKMTSDTINTYEANGIHVKDQVAERKIDVVLNARCNAAKGHQIPNEITCCMKYPKKNLLQIAVYLGATVAVVCLAISGFFKRQKSSSVGLHVQAAICIILIVVAYCAIADRGHTFVKINRHYDFSTFMEGCFIFFLLSLNSLKSSSINDKGFLSRDQSNEWKGWMQALILLYHYNHASQTLWVYKLVRLLVSGYIFLSGYGHTMYLLKTEDYSLRRAAAVIFRLNFLSALLPYIMKTDYSFYYFAPLITFWYLVVFLTLRVFKNLNQDPVLLFAKVLIAAIVTSYFIFSQQPLRLLSRACLNVFRMHWDATEARFRLSLDRYIVFFGIVTASIVHRMSVIKDILVFPDAHTKPIKPLACAFSALFILFFTVMNEKLVHEKEQYNDAHPYMSWIPILSFLILRNSHRRLRNSFMTLPAALGEISLETYVLQYHIWLGGDATAKLGFGIWKRYAGL